MTIASLIVDEIHAHERQVFGDPGYVPKLPPWPSVSKNRILREGELPCRECGSGKLDHAARNHEYNPRSMWRQIREWWNR
jgi:hypothetical protein